MVLSLVINIEKDDTMENAMNKVCLAVLEGARNYQAHKEKTH
jgi:hypothetical protein